ncbi:MAG: O-antigen ligase [Flavobacteriaceae bacterium]|jgi:O-antigen ligase
MFKEYNLKEKALFATAFLMLSVLIIHDQLIPPFILLFFLSSIPFWKGRKQVAQKKVLFPTLLLFILYAFSLLMPSETNVGVLSLTTKLSFFIFPLIGLLMSNGFTVVVKGVKWGMILASLGSMLFSLVRAIYTQKGFSGDAFHSNVYGLNMHPSYLALIFIVACALLWGKKSTKSSFKVFKWLYMVITLVSIFYLRSLGAFACIAVILGGIPIWKTLQTKNWKWLLTIPVYGLLFFFALKSSPRISNDVKASLSKVAEWSHSPSEFIDSNVNNIESNTVRLVVWTISFGMIVEHPFGLGLGNENDYIGREYNKYGYSGYAERNLNPHNQFLQTGVSIGWIGLIILLVLFFTLVRSAYKTRSLALFISALSLTVSCLFESMLERQVGVIFLSIILLIIVFSQPNLIKSQATK